MAPVVNNLIPYAHVADVPRSVKFYELLGFRVISRHEHPRGKLLWAHLEANHGRIMLAQADGPVDAGVQAILFYLYADDVAALRKHLHSRIHRTIRLTQHHSSVIRFKMGPEQLPARVFMPRNDAKAQEFVELYRARDIRDMSIRNQIVYDGSHF